MRQFLISYLIITIIGSFVYEDAMAQSVNIQLLPTNSTFKNDFSPYVHDSFLYFTSNRKHELIKTYLDQNREGLYRLYSVRLLPDEEYTSEKVFRPHEFSKLNTASISYSKDGSRIAVTQNQYTTIKRSKGRQNLLGIFFIENKDGKWKRPKAFPYNSRRKYSNAHPSLSPDGNTLFYITNQPGGYGETDIYTSTFENGEWTEPVNLGEVVNTNGKELFPFYHPSGKLYFSSEEHGSLGGMDIFYTTWNGLEWTVPVPLNEPVNSSSNDFSCYISVSENDGFFASDRAGSDNIYKFSFPFPSFSNAKPQIEDNFCLVLYENGPFKSDTLPYIYKWYFGDGTSDTGLEVRHCFPGVGLYNVQLSVYDTLANVDLFTVAQYELNLEQTQQVYISCPDTIKVNESVYLSAQQSVLKDFLADQFYWDLGKGIRKRGEVIHHTFRDAGEFTISCGTISKINPKKKMCSTRKIVVIE
jgi:hypothetical protein